MQVSRRSVLIGTALALAAGASSATGLGRPAAAAEPPAAGTGPLSDEAFFGAWSAAGQEWTTAPQLDYAGHPLAAVENAARQGDYTGASAALLAYYRDRAARTTSAWTFNGVNKPELVPLWCDNIFTLGKGDIYLATTGLSTATATKDVVVTKQVAATIAARGIGFMLMARVKGAGLATLASRHAAQGAPELVVTTAAGERRIPASRSTYIAAGSAATVHGAETDLLVRENGVGPFTDQTCKSFLWFDLTEVAAPTKATLRITGSSTTTGMQVMVYEIKQSFDEASRTWDNTVQATYSYQGDPGGFDWKQPAGGDTQFLQQLPRFYFAGPMADNYAKTGNETVAAALVRHMTDFIEDADSYASQAGAAGYPQNLAAAHRAQNWLYALERLRRSPSLTAGALTEILKTLVRTAAFLRYTESTTPNHTITHMSALLYISGTLPELAGSPAWQADALRRLSSELAASVRSDGGYLEATSSYGFGVAADFLNIGFYCKANSIAFTPGENLHKLAWYLADQIYPNGFDPAYGDSGYTDKRAALGDLADYFDSGQLRFVATLGTQGTAPDHTGVVYPDTRVVVQRTGWTAKDWYLRMALDRGAHQHPDELAIQLYAQDRPLLPAMGADNYTEADPVSHWLRRSTQSHNTVTIDGAVQDPTAAGAVDNLLDGSWARISSGWTDATPGVRHSRDAIMIDGGPDAADGFWLITDTLLPGDSGTHTYEQNWHLLPDADPALDGLTARTAFGSGTNLTIMPLLTDGLTGRIGDGYYSRAFYEVTRSGYAGYTRTSAGPTRLATLLIPELPQAARTVTATTLADDTRRSVLQLDLGDNRHAVVCLADGSGATGALPAGHAFDGTFAYLERQGGRVRLLADQWRGITVAGARLTSARERLGATAITLDLARGEIAIEAAAADGPAQLRIAAPWASKVTVNGETRAVGTRGSALTVELGS